MNYEPMPKIPRFRRQIVVTEKIDGTNGCVLIATNGDVGNVRESIADVLVDGVQHWVFAASRTRLITPQADNFGFAKWVRDNAAELAKLGPGQHFGEWWGAGIQRRYGQTEKRFSLFNPHRWTDDKRPACCGVVPVLYSGPFDVDAVDACLQSLRDNGSVAAPGFMNPEGVIVYHSASRQVYKVTLDGDEHKGVAA